MNELINELTEGGNGLIALYARVSTDRQDAANQLPDLRAAARGAIEYIDQDEHGDTHDRPNLRKMVLDAKAHKFDTIVVWRLDRLTRAGGFETLMLLDELHRAGVKVRSLRETWLDPANPLYEGLVALVGCLARMELEAIRERTKAGMARARAQGKRIGRPRANVSKNAVLELRTQGWSIRRIAAAIGATKSTVAAVLKDGSRTR